MGISAIYSFLNSWEDAFFSPSSAGILAVALSRTNSAGISGNLLIGLK